MEVLTEIEKGFTNRGNQSRLKRVMKKASAGEDVTIAFLGGSITQGSLASEIAYAYAQRVTRWWQDKYPMTKITGINAGIGGTTSHFGVARVEEDVLRYQPDLVFVEFSVNDDAEPFFMETYEGLIRRILTSGTKPAVVLIHNVRYDTGGNAQVFHSQIGRYYELPSVSMQSSILPKVLCGELEAKRITEDNLHPNDFGHELVAGVVTSFLEQVDKEKEEAEEEYRMKQEPLTKNCYEQAVRYNNKNADVILSGFETDVREQDGITDIFKNGWTASAVGDSVTFHVSGSEIAIQYRKTVCHPAPVAEAAIDGNWEEKQVLDGNFTEDWGDCLYLQPVMVHGEQTEHTVEIRIVKAESTKIPFYLNSIITANK